MIHAILGSAGTGKTQKLAQHTSTLLEENSDKHVLFLCGQARLGDDFLGLVRQQGGDPGKVTPMTWTTFCLGMIQNITAETHKENTATPMHLISVSEELRLCLQLATPWQLSPTEIRDMVAAIRHRKTHAHLPKTSESGDMSEPLHPLYDAYQALLEQEKFVDEADILHRCATWLSATPMAGDVLARTYQAVVVDHAETLGTYHWQILNAFLAAGHTLLLAQDTQIRPFNSTLRHPTAVHKLSETESPVCRHVLVYDAQEEAYYIASTICHERRHGTLSFRDVGLLYRSPAQLQALIDGLEAYHIPYKHLGKPGLQTSPLMGMLPYIRLIETPSHWLALIEALRTPPYALSREAIEIVQEHLKQHPLSPTGIWAPLPQLADDDSTKLTALLDLIQTLRQAHLSHRNTADTLADLVSMSGYGAVLEDDDTLSAVEDMEAIMDYITRVDPETSLTDIISEHLFTHYDQEERSGDVVSLVSAKNLLGRRFETVFVPGLENGIFPHHYDISDPYLETEEKNTFYRALTRGNQAVHLISAYRRTGYPPANWEDIPVWIQNTWDKTGPTAHKVFGIPVTYLASKNLAETPFATVIEAQGYRVADVVTPLSAHPQVRYKIHDQIQHPTWGLGHIEACEGEADSLIVTVRFSDNTRKLMAKYLRIAPITAQETPR